MGILRRHPWASSVFGILYGLTVLGTLTEEDDRLLNTVYVTIGWGVIVLVYIGLAAIVSHVRGSSHASAGQPHILNSPAYDVSTNGNANGMYPTYQPLIVPPNRMPVLAPTLGDVLMLTPSQFEDLTVEIMTAIGYRDATRTGGSGDLGADVVCRDPQGRATVVQCKRYAPGSSIGTPVIQTFIGMKDVHHRADRGIFVTTAVYSQPAVELAKQHGIALIDGPALLLLAHLTGVRLASPQVLAYQVAPNSASERQHIPAGVGFSTLPQPGQRSEETVTCPRCGSAVPLSAHFCPSCGLKRYNPPS